MTSEEMRDEFYALYNMMANSNEVAFMRTFGNVHKEMMEWFIENNPDLAQEWIEKLESIRWKNYLTPKEAKKIVDNMTPEAPWPREQWLAAMEEHGYDTDREPCYNSCALWVTMNGIMSDSSTTLTKYVSSDDMFSAVYDLAVDRLTDKDGMGIRHWYGL